MKMLRAAIGGVALALPSFEEGVQQRLLAKYREAIGERGSSARYSAAAMQLDNDAAGLRRTFAAVLGSCLYSQLDRLQGREESWPMGDGDGPGLVPDEVITRRMIIDNLTRRIDLDADEGFNVFDRLLNMALGRQPAGLRNNPLRPAVFLHAIGQCWTRAGGMEELALIEGFGEQLLPRVANVYPAMCAVLREGLNQPKPPSINAMALARAAGGAEGAYSRLRPSSAERPAQPEAGSGRPPGRSGPAEPARPAPSMPPSTARPTAAQPTAAQPTPARPSMAQPQPASARPLPAPSKPAAARAIGSVQADSPTAQVATHAETVSSAAQTAANDAGRTVRPATAQAPAVGDSLAHRPALPAGGAARAAVGPLDDVSRLFEPMLTDERLPVDVRLAIARLQVPALQIARDDPAAVVDETRPFRLLLAELADPAVWEQGVRHGRDTPMRLQLGVIVGMLNHQAPLARSALHNVLQHLIQQFRSLRSDAKVIDLSQHKAGSRLPV